MKYRVASGHPCPACGAENAMIALAADGKVEIERRGCLKCHYVLTHEEELRVMDAAYHAWLDQLGSPLHVRACRAILGRGMVAGQGNDPARVRVGALCSPSPLPVSVQP